MQHRRGYQSVRGMNLARVKRSLRKRSGSEVSGPSITFALLVRKWTEISSSFTSIRPFSTKDLKEWSECNWYHGPNTVSIPIWGISDTALARMTSMLAIPSSEAFDCRRKVRRLDISRCFRR